MTTRTHPVKCRAIGFFWVAPAAKKGVGRHLHGTPLFIIMRGVWRTGSPMEDKPTSQGWTAQKLTARHLAKPLNKLSGFLPLFGQCCGRLAWVFFASARTQLSGAPTRRAATLREAAHCPEQHQHPTPPTLWKAADAGAKTRSHRSRDHWPRCRVCGAAGRKTR